MGHAPLTMSSGHIRDRRLAVAVWSTASLFGGLRSVSGRQTQEIVRSAAFREQRHCMLY